MMRERHRRSWPERTVQKEMGQGQCRLSFPLRHAAVQNAEKSGRTYVLPAVWCQWKGSVVQSSPNYLFVEPAKSTVTAGQSLSDEWRQSTEPTPWQVRS